MSHEKGLGLDIMNFIIKNILLNFYFARKGLQLS